ncbi:uncharacterized protein LY89DRAFT_196281 [Mollisia scopiformis]|uniref:Secreted protein n=1 Tax=Mollisia scopiformis TaxID=149040 RepID=A0A194WZ62_MOLSC|nr:uncharacterized protein LY89DRAFT_196281 [Mollisia scopiformis]KUJ12887.1 hypothetical protein LY89DRAFT_196281 [Mollisia scopiformis]
MLVCWIRWLPAGLVRSLVSLLSLPRMAPQNHEVRSFESTSPHGPRTIWRRSGKPGRSTLQSGGSGSPSASATFAHHPRMNAPETRTRLLPGVLYESRSSRRQTISDTSDTTPGSFVPGPGTPGPATPHPPPHGSQPPGLRQTPPTEKKKICHADGLLLRTRPDRDERLAPRCTVQYFSMFVLSPVRRW